jgi:hypothetical protein
LDKHLLGCGNQARTARSVIELAWPAANSGPALKLGNGGARTSLLRARGALSFQLQRKGRWRNSPLAGCANLQP